MTASVASPKRDRTGSLPLLVSCFAALLLLILTFFSLLSGKVVVGSACIALLLCFPPLVLFELRRPSARELSAVAVMTALSVFGRIVFAPFPGFKPVSAVVILTGLAFGPLPGFITGASSALLSNLFFGQGPWTPFQMLGWGLLGLIAGLFRRLRGRKLIPVTVFLGILGGVLFSALTDVWTTVSSTGSFLPGAYLTVLLAGFPFTVVYVVSNLVFLLLLARPILRKSDRVTLKYGLFSPLSR